MYNDKFSFKTPSKHVSSIPLNRINVTNNINPEETDIKKNKADMIELIYSELQTIINSKKGDKIGKTFNGKEINEKYFTIFGKKNTGLKNDKIDSIVNFFKTYTPRETKNKVILVNLSDNLSITKSKKLEELEEDYEEDDYEEDDYEEDNYDEEEDEEEEDD